MLLRIVLFKHLARPRSSTKSMTNPRRPQVGARPWTLLTSTFSHEEIFHLIANLATLMETGPVVEEAIGTRDMARLFVVSGSYKLV